MSSSLASVFSVFGLNSLIFSITPQMAEFLGNFPLETLFCGRPVISCCPLLNEAEPRNWSFFFASLLPTVGNTMLIICYVKLNFFTAYIGYF